MESGAGSADGEDVQRDAALPRLGRLVLKARSLGPEGRALALVFVVLGALSVYRAFDIWTTGFFVTDEYLYVFNALHPAIYADRWFFGLFNIYLFRLLGINDITKVTLLLPFYALLWDTITILSIYGILKLMRVEGKVIALSLLSALFLISFVLLSVGYLTEPVGLALAMMGIFLLMLLALRTRPPKLLPLYSLLAALAFAAARYTREPYAIFMIAGFVLVPTIIIYRYESLSSLSRIGRYSVVALTIAFFVVPSGTFLVYPNSIIGDVTSLSTGIGQTVAVPITVTTQTITFQQITNFTITAVTTVTGTTIVHSNTTVTNTSTVTTTYVTSTTIKQQQAKTNFILNNRLVNTVYVFLGGMVLGWGPIIALLGLAGAIALVRRLRTGPEAGLAFIAIMFGLSLLSYLVVSYIFASDPSYLTLQHYSTIIRFSDTSIPAFFLVAPFVYPYFARSRRRMLTIVAVLLVFTVALVPAYEGFASSGLNIQDNPFSLGYHNVGIEIRDYVQSHPTNTPYIIVGFPQYDWFWTPGSESLQSVHLFAYPNQTQFAQYRWSDFYVWGEQLNSSVPNSPYALDQVLPYLFPKALNQPGSGLQFRLVEEQVVMNASSSLLIHFVLDWNSTG